MNIPQRARELLERLLVSPRPNESIFAWDRNRITMILAFAVEVERNALKRAIEVIRKAYVHGFETFGETAIRALIDAPEPERPDPTVALARFFEAEWGDAGAGVGRQLKWDDAALKVGLIEPDDPGFDYQLTALGIEAVRIAKENECG